MKTLIRLLAFHVLLLSGSSLLAQEYGLASYYSDKFQGKPTASGELYDKNQLTAAHKTLPYGSIIEVTRLDNKKSVRVRVNDRGPYISGRVVDISRKAAERLGLINDGTARVKVDIIEKGSGEAVTSTTPQPVTKPTTPPPVTETPATTTTPKSSTTPPASTPETKTSDTTPKKAATSPPKTTTKPAATAELKVAASSTVKQGALVTPQTYSTYGLYQIELRQPAKQGYGVQVASLTNYENVLKQVADLQGGWFKNILLSIEEGKNGNPQYKIILGPFEDRKAADNYKDNLIKKNKIKGFVVNLADLNY